MGTSAASEQRIEPLGMVQLLHDHLTTSLCQTVFQQTRTTERERQWSLEALASFWTEVILRAPHSLTQALQEAAIGNGSGWPHVEAAAASIGWTWSELACIEIELANPGVTLQKPDWHHCDFAWTTLEHIHVEPRNGRRRKRRFCPSRKQWKSFAHIPGGKKFT